MVDGNNAKKGNKHMKTKKLILAAALIGTVALSAQAGVRFGVAVDVPAPVVVAPQPVYVAPAPDVAIPACPGPDYIWAPGYWTVNGYSRVWISGNWQYRYGHYYGRGYDRDFHRDYDHDRDWHHR